MNPCISRYRENQITSSSPEKTVLMLFDGAINFLKSAIVEIEDNGNNPEKARLLEKTVKVIDHLQSCLDTERGGIIAENLNRLYNYIQVKLTEANLKNDIGIMREIVDLLLTIRDGWNSVCEQIRSGYDADADKAEPPSKTTLTEDDSDLSKDSDPERKIAIRI